MTVDLRDDRKFLLRHIKARAKDYPVYVNEGPGEDEDEVAQITFGYQFDQSGWFALVFDTRPDAVVDGEWQHYIEENALDMEHWCGVSDSLYIDEKPVTITQLDGKRRKLTPEDDFAHILGEMLRDLLIECVEQGVFAKLPLTSDCSLTVEEHDGAYGWTSHGEEGGDDEEAEEDDPFAVTAAIKSQAAKLSGPKQIKFWLERLQRISEDTQADPEDLDYDVDGNIDELADIGADAVVPMLELAVQLSAQSEFAGDRPGDVMELYRSTVLQSLLHKVDAMEHASPKIEKLLKKVVAQSVQVNAKRKLCGAAGFFAAQALFNLFDKYPCPELGEQNELVDPSPYV